jgi:hypothetical protein
MQKTENLTPHILRLAPITDIVNTDILELS